MVYVSTVLKMYLSLLNYETSNIEKEENVKEIPLLRQKVSVMISSPENWQMNNIWCLQPIYKQHLWHKFLVVNKC